MCVDHSPPAGRPAVLHDVGPMPQVVLEPVDAVEITALMDNVTDVFMPDQGPARRPGLLPGKTRASAVMAGGRALDALVAEHGFSMLLAVHKGASTHRVLFDAGASPDGVRGEHAPAGHRPRLDRGGGLQPRPLRPHHRPRRPDRRGGPGEHAGPDPPAFLAAAPGAPARDRAAGDPDRQPAGAGGRRVRRPGGSAAQLPARRLGAGHRRGAAGHRLRAGLPAAAGVAGRRVGAGPAGAGRPGHHHQRAGQGADRADRLRPRRDRQHLPLRAAAHRGPAAVRGDRRVPPQRTGFEPLIPRVLDDLAEMGPQVLVPAHCTGWRAQHAMAPRFGEAFIPNAVGSRFRL